MHEEEKTGALPPRSSTRLRSANRFFILYQDHALCNQCAIVKTESLEPLMNKGFAAHRILLKLYNICSLSEKTQTMKIFIQALLMYLS